jgi:hypothetical protein
MDWFITIVQVVRFVHLPGGWNCACVPAAVELRIHKLLFSLPWRDPSHIWVLDSLPSVTT